MNFRWARCLALGALLALAAAPLAFARTPWPPPADGILANDPAVVWGRLPNGLRYAIMPARRRRARSACAC